MVPWKQQFLQIAKKFTPIACKNGLAYGEPFPIFSNVQWSKGYDAWCTTNSNAMYFSTKLNCMWQNVHKILTSPTSFMQNKWKRRQLVKISAFLIMTVWKCSVFFLSIPTSSKNGIQNMKFFKHVSYNVMLKYFWCDVIKLNNQNVDFESKQIIVFNSSAFQ